MKNLKQRPTKTAGYSFSTQAARRRNRRIEAQIRQASPGYSGTGLREQIANSNNEATIRGIHANGLVRYTGASAKTRRQWSATAKRRIKQLTQQ